MSTTVSRAIAPFAAPEIADCDRDIKPKTKPGDLLPASVLAYFRHQDAEEMADRSDGDPDRVPFEYNGWREIFGREYGELLPMAFTKHDDHSGLELVVYLENESPDADGGWMTLTAFADNDTALTRFLDDWGMSNMERRAPYAVVAIG